MTTTTIPVDFREEFETERASWLRRRVFWYCVAMLCVAVPRLVVITVIILFNLDPESVPFQAGVVQILAGIVYIGGLGTMLHWLRCHTPTSAELLRLVTRFVVAVGLVDVVYSALIGPLVIPDNVDHVLKGPLGPMVTLLSLLAVHLGAALFVPWTPREAARPLVPLLVAAGAAIMLFAPVPLVERLRFVALSPLAGAPGLAVCAWRHSRFVRQFTFRVLETAYGSMKQELVAARRIHEALFPEPFERDGLKFDLEYRPYRDLGGDFVFELRDERYVNVVVLDVTGHGIGAALTVNRVHGEMQRLFGEHGALGPGDLVAALNRYFLLTLASQQVFATALCLRVDPGGGRMEWASAGHPPGFLRTAGGAFHRLDATCTLLGVTPEASAGTHRELPFGPGDAVLAYTDGVIEARRGDGQMLGIEGLEAMLSRVPEAEPLSARLLRDIGRAGFRKLDDDALVVEITAARTPPRSS